jgi:hypothetical protein
MAEVEVEPSPFMVLRTLERRHAGLLQPAFIGHHGFWGNLLHGNLVDGALR